MSRRNSSQIRGTLGNLFTEENITRPDCTTTVIEIGDDDEINTGVPFSSSTERIFDLVVDDIPVEDIPLGETQHISSETCSKLRSWFQRCGDGNIFLYSRNQIIGFINAKLAALNRKLETRCEKSYLELYFLYANVCGVSPFRFGKQNKPVTWLKKVPYYVVSTLAIVDTVGTTKRFILEMIGAQERGSVEIRMYLNNSLIAANILLRVGFFVSLRFQSKKYFKAIEAISASSFRKHLYTTKRQIESFLICGISFSIVLLKTHVGLLSGFEDYVNQNAEDSLSIFCISRASCQQINLDGLSSSAVVVLGILGWAANLAGMLLGQIARDGILFSSLTLGKSVSAFRFKERMKEIDSENALAHVIGSEIHTEYKDIKRISKRINSAFNIVFRFFLLANVFMFAIFIDQYFNPHIGKLNKLLKSINVLFVCITFYFANQAAKTGERFKDWIKKEKHRNIMGMTEMNVMTENSSSPNIGYGRGAFFIYDSTLIGFASVVAAYFLGIVETRQQFDFGSGLDELSPCLNGSILR